MEEARLDTDLNPNEGIITQADADDRLDAEFQYVIGHVTQRDVVVDGQVVVPAGTEVTGADAAGALAAGALEDLAFAVGAGDPSLTEPHGRPDPVDETPDVTFTSGPANDPGATLGTI